MRRWFEGALRSGPLGVCIVLGSSGCEGDERSESSPRSSASVGPEGGIVEAPFGASVTVPPGALSDEVTLNVEAALDVPDMPDRFVAAGDAVAFTPHGLRFLKPVTLRLPARPKATRVLRLDDQDDETWEAVTLARFEGGFASVETSGFSIYAPASELLSPDASVDAASELDGSIPEPPDSSAPPEGGANSTDCAPQIEADFQRTPLPGGLSGDTAIAVDRDGMPHVVIRDDATRAAYYATNRSGAWVLQEIESDANPLRFGYPSIALQPSGVAHVCVNGRYLTNAGGTWRAGDFQGPFSTCAVGVGTGDAVFLAGIDEASQSFFAVTNRNGWTSTEVAAVNHVFRVFTAVGADDTQHIAWQDLDVVSHYSDEVVDAVHSGSLHSPDIAVDSAGAPVVAIFDQLPTVWRVILKRRDGTTWVEEPVRSDADSAPRLALDARDAPHLLYVSRGPVAPEFAPELNYSVKREGVWEHRQIVADSEFEGFDIAVTGEGRPHLTYRAEGGTIYATLPCADLGGG